MNNALDDLHVGRLVVRADDTTEFPLIGTTVYVGFTTLQVEWRPNGQLKYHPRADIIPYCPTPKQQWGHLCDAMAEDIITMSEEDLAECIEDGIDVKATANRVRALLLEAFDRYRDSE